MLAEVVCEIKSELGEGPVWDGPRGLISWVDILNGLIHEWSPENRTHRTIRVGQMIGAMAVCTDGNYVAALQNGFAFVDRRTGEVDFITDPEKNLPNNRFNDGKCDPSGRFWAGTLPFSEDMPAGSLYMLDKDRSVTIKEDTITISNGLAWSLKDRAFYFIDTPTLKVVRYDYDDHTGHIAHKTTVIHIPREAGFPDGMTIDDEGMLWIAHWGGWQVTRWNPVTGRQLTSFKLPVSNVTSCTFGGDTLEDLYITSARKGLNETELGKQPLAGSLFVIKNCGYRGVPAHEFRL